MDNKSEVTELELLDFSLLFYVSFKSRTSGISYPDLKDFCLRVNNNEEQFMVRINDFINKNWITRVYGPDGEVTAENYLLFIQNEGNKKYREDYDRLFPILKARLGVR